MSREKYGKRGYMSAGIRPRYFGNIHIDGDFHFEPKHNLIFNVEFEEDELYMGRPCIFTDSKYDTGAGTNYFKSTYIKFARRSFPKAHQNEWLKKNRKPKDYRNFPLTLKACIRRMKKIKGLPKGTEVTFGNDYYYTKNKGEPTFVYIHNGRDGKYRPEYKIDNPCVSNMFTKDEWGNELITKLRAAGFIVNVFNENPDRLIGEHEGELAFAYGFNKKIGISTFEDCFNGYHNGCKNILYDFRHYFNKWSQALEISKKTPIDEIVNRLIKETVEEAYVVK